MASRSRNAAASSKPNAPSVKSTTKTMKSATTRKPAAVSTEQITRQMESLALGRANKGKAKAPQKTLDELRLDTMRKVNTANQALSRCVAARDKQAQSPRRAKDLQEAQSSAQDALLGLAWLRSHREEPSLDVERAAVSVLSKLVSLELVSLRQKCIQFRNSMPLSVPTCFGRVQGNPSVPLFLPFGGFHSS